MKIKDFLKSKYKKLKIIYVEQKDQLGTANALLIAKPYIKNRFLLMAGDDIYSKEDIKKCIKYRYAVLTSKASNPNNFGVILEKNNILTDFIEKPDHFVSNNVNTSFYCLDKKIFKFLSRIKKSERNEFELPDAIKLLSKEDKIYCIRSRKWLPISYPWDLLKADKSLRKNKNSIGKNSKIYGKLTNSSIGDNCLIKGTVRNSIVMDNTFIDEGSFIEDSVLGENVYFKGTIKSQKNVHLAANNKKAKIVKFGAIIGDNSKLFNVSVAAGCVIFNDKVARNAHIKHSIL